MSLTTVTVDTAHPIGTINPRVYGHFAEHLGRCCYDGLRPDAAWPAVPTENGFRTDVLEALRALPVTMLRWPGGCYADHYHWRDGIGAPDARTRTLGMSCGLQVEDDNALGTHEFMWLCNYLGAEAYLAGNVGSSTVQELCDWMEYCNTPLNTTLGALRRANGAAAPFGVKLWGVGNENWGCGGEFDAVTYAHEYRRFASNLRHVDGAAELVLCGHTDEWNAQVLEAMGPKLHLVDHLSIHRYWIEGGPETAFSADGYYHLLDEAEGTEAFVQRTAALIDDVSGRQPAGSPRKIGVALDEWGVWHPEARPWGPDAAALQRTPTTYEQAGTLRDALAAAVALEGFHRQCNVLALANLAQIVNVLHAPVMTEQAQMWLTPTYHLLHMHKPHIGAQALPVAVDGGASLPAGGPSVSATASTKGDRIALTIINRHLTQPAEIRIAAFAALAERAGATQATGTLLASASPADGNSAAAPEAVSPVALVVSADGSGWRVELPAHSVGTIVLAAG